MSPNQLNIGSWNLEELTNINIHEVCEYMKTNSVDVMCIQECRNLKSDEFWSDSGHIVLLSGSGRGLMEWAGVAFVVAPNMQTNRVSDHFQTESQSRGCVWPVVVRRYMLHII